jgi:hypothetical protein
MGLNPKIPGPHRIHSCRTSTSKPTNKFSAPRTASADKFMMQISKVITTFLRTVSFEYFAKENPQVVIHVDLIEPKQKGY